LVIREILKKA